jgi:integrase
VSPPKSAFEEFCDEFLPPVQPVETTPEPPLLVELHDDRLEFYGHHVEEDAFWPWLTRLILDKPKLVASRTGIEEIGYLSQLTKPAPSPTLVEVGRVFFDRTDLSDKELQKCRSTWAEFTAAVGVSTLRELHPELVAAWGQRVRKQDLAAKTVYHRFNRIKTVLNHFRTTGRCIDDVRHAVDCCAVLKAPETTSLDPHPISRGDFTELLHAAGEGEGQALLLTALNLCLYPIDVARLRWGELDLKRGVYHAKRGKTKVARCAVLWSRTTGALEKVVPQEDDDFVFHRESGRPHTATTVRKWFWKLRERAGVRKEVQFADMRDGAFTEAVAGEGVEFRHAQVLAGHRAGIADAYVLRNPRMVSKACAAVEHAYFG